MKLTIRNLNLPTLGSLDSVIKIRLSILSERLRIDDAAVVLERDNEASPPYRVRIHLSVPGPDLHTEQVDHTPIQSLNRAFKYLENKIRERTVGRLARAKARSQAGSRVGLACAH